MRTSDGSVPPAIFIAGAYEFISDDGADHAVEEAYAPLVAAYDSLRYDAGALTPAESAKLASKGIAAPKGWVVLDPKEPRTKLLDTPKGKIGVVFFPMGKKPGDGPTEDQAQAVARKIKELRSQSAMVIGVSPWGVQAESDYLEKVRPDLDVLLGSGPGVGFSAKPYESGHVLWMHSYSKGKAIYTLDLLAMPGDKNFKWEMGSNYTTQALVLDEKITPDQEMTDRLQDVPDPGDKTAKQ